MAFATQDKTDGSALPAPPLRTTVSFLLFLHAFALFVGLVSNWNASELEMKLRNVPGVRPYLQLIGQDRSYIPLYSLTYADPEDADHSVEVELELPDGKRQTVVLPPPEIKAAQRRRRYVRLTTVAGLLSGNADVESLLPQAIASHLMARYGATGGTIRCRRNFLISIDQAADTRGKGPPIYSESETLFEASIVVLGGRVQLLKTESATDSAPAAREGSASVRGSNGPRGAKRQGSDAPQGAKE